MTAIAEDEITYKQNLKKELESKNKNEAARKIQELYRLKKKEVEEGEIILKRTEPKIILKNIEETTNYRLFSEKKNISDYNIKIKRQLGKDTTGSYKTVYVYENSDGVEDQDNILSLTHPKWNSMKNEKNELKHRKNLYLEDIEEIEKEVNELNQTNSSSNQEYLNHLLREIKDYKKSISKIEDKYHKKMKSKQGKLLEEYNSFKIQQKLSSIPGGNQYIPEIIDYGSFCKCKEGINDVCNNKSPCVDNQIMIGDEIKLGNGIGVYSIQTKIKGGELFDRLLNGEYVANLNRQKVLVKNIINAIKFIHEKGYAHYDLKPENILMVKNTDNVKIIDFGFTKKHGQIVGKFFGTPEYISPEVLNKNFNQKADYWALGCIFVLIFCNSFLYSINNIKNTFKIIRRNPKQFIKNFNNNYNCGLDEHQIDFLSQFFQLPGNLPSFDELLKHPYLSIQKKGGKSQKTLKKNKKVKKFRKNTRKNIYKKKRKTKYKNRIKGKFKSKQIKRSNKSIKI